MASSNQPTNAAMRFTDHSPETRFSSDLESLPLWGAVFRSVDDHRLRTALPLARLSLYQKLRCSRRILVSDCRSLVRRIAAMWRKYDGRNWGTLAVHCRACLAAGNLYCYILTDDCMQYIEQAVANRPELSTHDVELLAEGWGAASAKASCNLGIEIGPDKSVSSASSMNIALDSMPLESVRQSSKCGPSTQSASPGAPPLLSHELLACGCPTLRDVRRVGKNIAD